MAINLSMVFDLQNSFAFSFPNWQLTVHGSYAPFDYCGFLGLPAGDLSVSCLDERMRKGRDENE